MKEHLFLKKPRRIMRIRILFIVFCGLLAQLPVFSAQEKPLFSDAGKTEKAKEHYSAGKRFFQTGEFAKADEEFKKAQGILADLKANPLPLANEKIKLPAPLPVEVKKSQDIEDVQFYHKAIAASPKNPNLYYNLGVEYLKINQFIQAKDAFSRAAQLNPNDKDAYYNLGVLCEKYLNDKKQALNYYLQFIKISPSGEDADKVKSWIQQITEERKAK